MYKLVEKRVLKKNKQEINRTKIFADYICNLFDNVINFYDNVGEITLYQKDFKLLGKKEVPCIYHVTEEESVLFLDYSYITSFWCKSFDNVKINYFILRKILSDKGINVFRECDHPEYEASSSLRTKDLLIFKMNRRVNEKALAMNKY